MISYIKWRMLCKAEDLYCHTLKGPGSKILCDVYDSWLCRRSIVAMLKERYAAGKK